MKKFIVIFVLFCLTVLYSENFTFNYKPGEKYNLTIRANIKNYVNGKYAGLNSKEVKSIIYCISKKNDNYSINTETYYLDKTIFDGKQAGFKLDENLNTNYVINNQGIFNSNNFVLFPEIQGIPFFPDEEININDSYEGSGNALVDLGKENGKQLLPVYIKTIYLGYKNWFGKSYNYFEIEYGYTKPETDIVSEARGYHKLGFYFDKNLGLPVYILDNFTEEFKLKSGEKIQHQGIYNYFYKTITPMNKNNEMNDLTNDIKITKEDKENFTFDKRDNGIAIILNNLKFKANSVDLLESENEKLDKLYKMLSKIKDRSFLITGHTALSGTEADQMDLSINRAKTIANYLINKGIDAKRIIYTGKGAKEPVAPNDTEENMQKNRRVEIIILED